MGKSGVEGIGTRVTYDGDGGGTAAHICDSSDVAAHRDRRRNFADTFADPFRAFQHLLEFCILFSLFIVLSGDWLGGSGIRGTRR